MITCAAAIDALREREFDLVMLDVDRPDGNGFEIHEWLLGQPASPPVIFVTADDLAEHAVEAVKSGAADYIVKRPSYFAEVTKVVARVLDEAASRREPPPLTEREDAALMIDLIGQSPGMVEARVSIVESAGVAELDDHPGCSGYFAG